MKVSSYSGLRAAILSAMAASIKDVGKEAEEVVKKRIDSDVYGAGSPSEYGRTMSFRESIISELKGASGSSVSVTVKSSGSGYHPSVVSGADVSGGLDKIIHDGLAGKIFGEGFWTAPRPFMDNAKAELRGGKFRVMAVKALRKNGLNVK